MAYRGSCQDMCPEGERQTRFGLYMSIFEKDQDNQPDERFMVKEYRRSGADQKEPSPDDLRTPQALELTMDYLVSNILDDSRSKTQALEWYDFLWDRLRAIRKDITQQNICDQASALLVERCARFHVHSCYAMNRVKNFDVDMNKRNLNDCLQMLRQMYYDLKIMGLQCAGELEFQKYDILLHLDEDHLSSIVLMKTSDYRESKEMRFITQVFYAYTNNQYHKFFQLMKTSDYLTSCILSLYANKMRLIGLKTIINACAPRQTTLYPAPLVLESLGFDDLDDLKSFASACDLRVQHKEDGNCFLVLSRDVLKTLKQGESLIQPYKSRRLVEYKTSGKPVGLLVDGREMLPRKVVKPSIECIVEQQATERPRSAEEPDAEDHDMVFEEDHDTGEKMDDDEEEEDDDEEDDDDDVDIDDTDEVEDRVGEEREDDDGNEDEREDEDENGDEDGEEDGDEDGDGNGDEDEDRDGDGDEDGHEDEEPFMVKRVIYNRNKIADMMPAGCYKVRSLSAKLPTLCAPPVKERTPPTLRKPEKILHRRLDSLAVGIDDEVKANEMFSQFIQELENSCST